MPAPDPAAAELRDAIVTWHLRGMLGSWGCLLLSLMAARTTDGLTGTVLAVGVGAAAVAAAAGLARHRLAGFGRLPLFIWPIIVLAHQTVFATLAHEAANLVLGCYVLTFLFVGVTQPVRRCWWLMPFAAASLTIALDLPFSHTALRVAVSLVVWSLVACWPAHLLAQVEMQRAQLARTVAIDPLTGVQNRTHLADHLAGTDRESALLLIDLDSFKLYNDDHGHLAGDALLQEFAQLLTRHSRATDTVYRFGGEEFLVVLQATSTAAAHDFADRLTAEWLTRGSGTTFSAGIAAGGDSGLLRADASLYQAKRAGRALIIVDPEDLAEPTPSPSA